MHGPSANPYLLMGALLAAGHDGIDRQAQLPGGVDVDPAWLDDEERARRGIERLPDNLDDVVAAFEGSRCWPPLSVSNSPTPLR